MSLGIKLLVLFSIYCFVLNGQPTQANPAEPRVARSSNDWYDWLSTLFDDSDETDEQNILCRNCTVIVQQSNNGTDAPVAQPTAATVPPVPSTSPNPSGGVGPMSEASPPVAETGP